MATTKVGGGVVDLNEQNTDTVFQMPVGSSSFTGTPVAGMIRNNTSITNNDATTAFEFYNGAQWVEMNTEIIPISSYLVIGGGGSGGAPGTINLTEGGGGGAGGYRNSYSTELSGGSSTTETPFVMSAGTTYTVTVGGGGAAATSRGATGNNGANSLISGSGITTITSLGGGYGASTRQVNNPEPGGNGGSGGGGTDYYGNAGASGTGTPGQGTNGGARCYSDGARDGGGASSSQPNGLYSSITGTSVGRAGGGQGAEDFLGCRSNCSGPNYAGFPEGGGNGWAHYPSGGCSQTGTAGVSNTGGGGGGGLQASNTLNYGKNGGSGVVILRMATAIYSGTTTGSPTVTTDGSDTILTFNGSGTYTH